MAFDLQAFLQRELAKQGTGPTRRHNRNHSGRALRRSSNSQKWVTSVGGRTSQVAAIYGGNDNALNDYQEMCFVVDREVKGVSDPRDARLPEYTAPQGQWLGRVPCV